MIHGVKYISNKREKKKKQTVKRHPIRWVLKELYKDQDEREEKKSGKIQMFITYVTSKCAFETVGSPHRNDKHLQYKHCSLLSWSTGRPIHNHYQEVELENKKEERNEMYRTLITI